MRRIRITKESGSIRSSRFSRLVRCPVLRAGHGVRAISSSPKPGRSMTRQGPGGWIKIEVRFRRFPFRGHLRGEGCEHSALQHGVPASQ